MFYTLKWVNINTQFKNINLKRFVKKLKLKNSTNFSIDSIKGVSDQKETSKNGKNVLSFLLDKNKNKKNINKNKPIVRLILRGNYKIGNYSGVVLMNLFNANTNNVSKSTLRISINTGVIVTQQKTNELIKSVLSLFDKYLGQSHSGQQIATLFVSGLSLISPNNGKKLRSGMKNVGTFYRLMGGELLKHDYVYDEISQNRTGKKVASAFYRPTNNGNINTSKTRPVIAITSTGIVQFIGKTSMDFVQTMSEHLVVIFKRIKKNLPTTILNSNLSPQKNTKSKTGCPKGNPRAINGKCSKGYHPRINKKNQVCCYKGRVDKTQVMSYIKDFKNKGVKIPEQYKDYASLPHLNVKSPNMVKNKKTNAFVISQERIVNGKIKENRWNCVVSKKDVIQRIARKHGLDNKGKKTEICERIKVKLMKPTSPAYVNNKKQVKQVKLSKLRKNLGHVI